MSETQKARELLLQLEQAASECRGTSFDPDQTVLLWAAVVWEIEAAFKRGKEKRDAQKGEQLTDLEAVVGSLEGLTRWAESAEGRLERLTGMLEALVLLRSRE